MHGKCGALLAVGVCGTVALTLRALGFGDLTSQAEAPDYAKVLAAQPAGLTLALDLPRKSFYQGEIIRGTLTYTNTSTTAYTATLAQGDRSGRVQDIRFFARDDKDHAVEDPIEWIYRDQPIFGGGQIREAQLGTGSVTLILNQWLRFDHPGTYTIFAESTSVRTSKPQKNPNGESLFLVSNKVDVTITPLDPAQETQIVADAARVIDDGYRLANKIGPDATINDDHASQMVYAAEPAIAALRYLQTPAARAALRSRLDTTPEIMIAGGHFEIAAALLGAPDRPAEAALILNDVKDGRLKLDSSIVSLYAQLKTYPLQMAALALHGPILTLEESQRLAAAQTALDQARKVAQDEILNAAKQASSVTGQSDLDFIWTAFLANPYDASYRAPLVAHQLELSHDRQQRLLTFMEMSSCSPHPIPGQPNLPSEFLPLIRLYLGPPAYSRDALILLSYARPEEAHAIVNADMRREQPLYFNKSGNIGELAACLHDNPYIHWTSDQMREFDVMRFPH